MLEIAQPPDIRTLLEDPKFAKFMRTRPRMPANAVDPRINPAWHLWVMLDTERWQRGKFRVYDDAYKKMKAMLKRDDVKDVAIVSVRVMFAPTPGLNWAERYPWCARCRRPSLFTTSLFHRALGNCETTEDDIERCFYCGHRYVTLPHYSPS